MPLIDAHVHGFPDPLFDAIWRYFIKNYWPINYKLYTDQISPFLMNQGVSHYTILNYAHKPGISREMNNWTYDFSQKHPEALCFGTIHPQDPYLGEEIERVLADDQLGLHGIKLQLLVTDFDPDIPELDVVYESLIRHGKILVMHSGTGPGSNEHVGIKKLLPVLDRYPDLRLQVPHLGCYEYLEFFDLVKDHPSVQFDTAMVLMNHGIFSDRFDPDTMLDAFLEIQDHVMFGSDFPNIPYDYTLALQSIDALPVSDAVKEKIAWKNAARFYNLTDDALLTEKMVS
ncbi:MAG TPA: amidohydrolase family protein [Candidatus Lokiarchaeia archaeon]|nr:amidohydrolase family protein [Candidatus Lokiarchaeia archaeon]